MRKGFLTAVISVLLFTDSFAGSIPVIEIWINNTDRSKDDYVGDTYLPCSVRLFNGTDFSSDIPVTLRNMPLGKGGQVLLSSTGGSDSGSVSLNLLIKKDNIFTTFYIKAKPGYPSLRDKDAILEVLDNDSTHNRTVLARKAFMVISSNPLPLTKPQVEMRVNSVSTLDDYVTWAPTLCRIRLSNYTKFTSAVTVTLRNMGSSTGKINFAPGTLTAGTTATDTTLTLSLPNTGAWVDFYIAGRFNYPSERDKDAIIEVVIAPNSVISRDPLMVRIRKNANTLSVEERERFLNALVTFNSTFNGYQTFIDIHSAAGRPESHDGPAFLTWHRAFILNLERGLQSVDPAVALPYWKYDESCANIFSADFIGCRPASVEDAFADFSLLNPMTGWFTGGTAGVRRTTHFADNATPDSTQIRNELATLALGSRYKDFRAMETNPHGRVHLQSGQTGDWIPTLPTAVRDPLFFLLHCNADRQWAKWQWINNRFDPLKVETYSLQGTFNPSIGAHIGHFLKDTMWPWNGITGTYDGTGTIPLDQRPTTAPGGPFPEALSLPSAPVSTPEPYHLINYRNNIVSPTINSGLGFCYDDVPYN